MLIAEKASLQGEGLISVTPAKSPRSDAGSTPISNV